jgi:hypothetical protein
MCSMTGSLRISSGGFPHSDISGSSPADGFPKLFAVNHVLHRLLTPRHPPCTLCSLITRLFPRLFFLFPSYSVFNVLPLKFLGTALAVPANLGLSLNNSRVIENREKSDFQKLLFRAGLNKLGSGSFGLNLATGSLERR